MSSTEKTDTVSFKVEGAGRDPSCCEKILRSTKGTRAVVYKHNDHIVLKPLTGSTTVRLRGSLKGTKAMEVFMSERNAPRAVIMATDGFGFPCADGLVQRRTRADEVEKICSRRMSGNPRLLMSVINWGGFTTRSCAAHRRKIADSKAHEIAECELSSCRGRVIGIDSPSRGIQGD